LIAGYTGFFVDNHNGTDDDGNDSSES